jgi:hypothetical protein
MSVETTSGSNCRRLSTLGQKSRAVSWLRNAPICRSTPAASTLIYQVLTSLATAQSDRYGMPTRSRFRQASVQDHGRRPGRRRVRATNDHGKPVHDPHNPLERARDMQEH